MSTRAHTATRRPAYRRTAVRRRAVRRRRIGAVLAAALVGDLATPQVNIAYGSWYLRYLMGRYAGNEAFALAAYNGGEGNVDRWIVEAQKRNEALTIDAIPFSETREYVLRVQAAAAARARGGGGRRDPLRRRRPAVAAAHERRAPAGGARGGHPAAADRR